MGTPPPFPSRSMILIWKADGWSAHWPMLPSTLNVRSICSVSLGPSLHLQGGRTKFHQAVASWLSFDSSLSIMNPRSSDINGFWPHRPPASRRSSTSRMPWNRSMFHLSSRLCRWRAQNLLSQRSLSASDSLPAQKERIFRRVRSRPSCRKVRLRWVVTQQVHYLLVIRPVTSHSVLQTCRVSALECPNCDTSPNRLRVLAPSDRHRGFSSQVLEAEPREAFDRV